MNRTTFRARLADIIRSTRREQEIHPDRWYPLPSLLELERLLITDAPSSAISSSAFLIRYNMFDSFHSYADPIFGQIFSFCIEIDIFESLNDALAILGNADAELSGLLRKWLSSFGLSTSLEDESKQRMYSTEFSKIIANDIPRWKSVFPPHIFSALAFYDNSDYRAELKRQGLF